MGSKYSYGGRGLSANLQPLQFSSDTMLFVGLRDNKAKAVPMQQNSEYKLEKRFETFCVFSLSYPS